MVISKGATSHRRVVHSFSVAVALSALASAQSFETRVVARDLHSPTGIATRGNNTVFFTEVPTPGVPGSQGGMNGVKRLRVQSEQITALNMGEPEPVNLAHARDGSLYWTCKSAGVILERTIFGEISPLLTGLAQPSGISSSFMNGDIYFTMLPTPGVPGSMGGMNTVNVFDGDMVTQLTMGEPEPTDIVSARNGDAYWTCKSAGVILRRSTEGEVTVLLRGLNKPTGIALNRRDDRLYFTEVPTPGVPGSMGGGNFVWQVELPSLARTIVNFGDPQPTDVAVAHNGTVYWTCTSAGVIVAARPMHRTDDDANDPAAAAELAEMERLDRIEDTLERKQRLSTASSGNP